MTDNDTTRALVEMAQRFDPVDIGIPDLDTALRVINALCYQIENLKLPPETIAGEYTIFLSPEHDDLLHKLYEHGRLAYEGDSPLGLDETFNSFVEDMIEIEHDIWKNEETKKPLQMVTALSA